MTAFISDNVSGIHPSILDAITRENEGYRMPYGNDESSELLNAKFSDLFETQVTVIPCATGTAANSLGLSLMAGAINSICVHRSSHVYVDECNAPEFYSGARLEPLAGEGGKIDLGEIDRLGATIGAAHSPQPSAITLTQTTEIGTLYSVSEVKAICAKAKKYGLSTHMDGARFANAVASLDCSPADITWRAGIDVLSFGATKNGCMAAEAVVIFDQSLAKEAAFRQKRAGQLLSKARFTSAQLLSYINDDLWLKNAELANSNLKYLCSQIAPIKGVELPENSDTNLMFARFTAKQNAALEQAGLAGYIFPDGSMRLCCSWATQQLEIQRFVDCVKLAA